MALDKQFLKYKLEKIKNERMDKNMDPPAKIYQREYNGRLAQDEAQAIHSYLGAEDVDGNDNSSITTEDVFFPYDDQIPSRFGGVIPAIKRDKVSIKESADWALDGKKNVGDAIKNGVTKKFIIKTYKRQHTTILGGSNIVGTYQEVTLTNGIVTRVQRLNWGGDSD